MKEIATAAGCMSGHGKRRWQKTLHRHVLTTGQGETKVGLKQKLPFHCWLLQRGMQATGGALSPEFLLGDVPYLLKYQYTKQSILPLVQ